MSVAGRHTGRGGLAVVDMHGRVVDADATACAILGVSADDLAGRRLYELVHPDDGPGAQRYVRPDGTVAWVTVRATLEAERVDGPRRVLVHLEDVTAQRALAERTRAPYGDRPLDGSWALDADGITTSVSESAAGILGYQPGEMLGRPLLDFVHEDDRREVAAALARRREGLPDTYEARWRRRDGRTAWLLVSVAPLFDDAGRYAGSFGIVTDATERRRDEQRRERHARQQQVVADLGRFALEEPDTAGLIEAAARECVEALDADMATVFTMRDDDRLVLATHHGLPPASRDLVSRLRRDGVPAPAALTTGAPFVVDDWQREDPSRIPSCARAAAARATVAVPIGRRRVLGALSVHSRDPWRPEDDQVRFLESVANVLASAIERAETEERARERALHDPLTGLPSRTLALDRAEHALSRTQRSAETVAAIVVGLDRFKRINETLGLEGGDEVLRVVAHRLRDVVEPGDTVARLSSDGFLVVCEGLDDEATAAAVAQRIVESVRAPLRVHGEWLSVTVSAGVASAGDDENAAELLRDAEAAMDRAKASGRDRFEVSDPVLRRRALDRLALERDLHGAAARGELFVCCQPIVSVADGHVTGVEALVRWRHPERGVVPPGDFIGIAEEAGIVGEIGAWVLHEACAVVAELRREGRAALTCHVNLSARQTADPELPRLVAEALAASGLPAEALVLELTETSLMESGDASLELMQAVREQGVRLVLDDFGTGYSSLSRLSACPIDGLKIDRSFIAELDRGGPRDALLVAGIVELARGLGLTVVAEGVETGEQLERLRLIGCRYAQGFLLGRPAGRDRIGRLLAREPLLPDAA